MRKYIVAVFSKSVILSVFFMAKVNILLTKIIDTCIRFRCFITNIELMDSKSAKLETIIYLTSIFSCLKIET